MGIVASATETSITMTAAGPAFCEGLPYIEYWVWRDLANADGGCVFDEWFGTAANLLGGGGCSNVGIWEFNGPVPAAGNIRVHVPNVATGLRTLDNGVEGIVPDPYEGNLAAIDNEQLEWKASLIVYSTLDYNQGGQGAAGIDWNNQNFWNSEFSISDNVQEASYFIWQ